MPQFKPGESKTATATFQNPKTAPFEYRAILYLGKSVGNKVVSSPVKTFTVPAGGTLSQDFAVTMPTTQDTYHAYLEVSQAGNVIAVFIGTEDVQIAAVYPIVFTGATIYPISILVSSGWWGTNYYAVAQMSISWNAAHRVPEVVGDGSGQIAVSGQITNGVLTWTYGYTTTPQTRESSGVQYYYFPPGGGSVGWPYAGMQLGAWPARPPSGIYSYTVNLIAYDGHGNVVGQNTLSGTVQVI